MSAVLQIGELQVGRAEVLRLGALDSIFYGRTFFPKTMRQGSPAFHRDFWNGFENPHYDFFAAEIFRGGAKTTLTRIGLSKRVAYGISRNILSVAIAENMAEHTVRWLKRQIENNKKWTDTFLLRKGKKWSDDWIEIVNESSQCYINVLAKGMTSGLRGLNLDDYRPDFIQCDDIENEETVGTEEQRNKNQDLFFGALVPTLAPKSEAPHRKLALLQTNLSNHSILARAAKDPTFYYVRYPKIMDTPQGPQSAWPERFSTEEVLKEKEDYVKRGQLHVWLREYGCRIVSRETSPLDATQLRKWTSLPTNLKVFFGIDPAIADASKKYAHKTGCVAFGLNPQTGDHYLMAYKAQKGMSPDEIWAWLVESYRTLRPVQVGTEAIGFQRILKLWFQQKMQESRIFFPIIPIQDRRSKPNRIIQAYSGLAANGKLWVHEDHVEFIQAYTEWREGEDSDILDAGAQAITLANPWMALNDEDAIEGQIVDEAEYPDLEYEGEAP